MPITLKSTEEARRQLVKSSKEVADKLGAISKSLTSKEEHLGQTIGVLGKGLDDLHSQCLTTWSAVTKLEENSTAALQGVQEAQKVLELQQTDLETVTKAANSLEGLAVEAKAEAASAGRTANTSLNAAQDVQLAASYYCLIFKGVPLLLDGEREPYRMLMVAFEETMSEIGLKGAIMPKSLRRIMKRGDDKSNRPPHIRVELSSVSQRIQIFDQIKATREASESPLTFSVAPDIPRYALKKYNALHKIAQIAREKHPTMHTRVSMNNSKWPELQIKNSQGEWMRIPEQLFEESKAIHNQRQKEISDKKKAAKRPNQEASMDIDDQPSTSGVKNLRRGPTRGDKPKK